MHEQEKEELGDSDNEEFRIAVPLKKSKPKRIRNYKNKMENWENAEVNLCPIYAHLTYMYIFCCGTSQPVVVFGLNCFDMSVKNFNLVLSTEELIM